MKHSILAGLMGTLFLTACGGGGGSSGDNGGQNPQQGTPFSVTVLTSNDCRVEAPLPNARVIFHAANGDIVSTQRAGTDGVLETTWPDGAHHVTVVGVGNNGEDPDIRTWIDWQSGDLGKVFFNWDNAAGCDCGTLALDTADVEAAYAGYDLYVDTGRYQSPLNYCVAQGEPLVLDLVLRSPNDFTPYADELLLTAPIPADLTLTAGQFSGGENLGAMVSVQTQDTYDYGYSFDVTELGYQRFYLQNDYYDTPYYFPGMGDHNLFQAVKTEYLGGNEFGDMWYRQVRRDAIENDVAIIDMPDSQVMYTEEAVRVISGILEGGSAGYDFTGVAHGANQLQVSLFDWSGDLNWSVFAPLKGDLPELDLPADLVANFDQAASPGLSVFLYGYNQAVSLDEFRRQAAMLRDSDEERPSFFDDYVYQDLYIQVY